MKILFTADYTFRLWTAALLLAMVVLFMTAGSHTITAQETEHGRRSATYPSNSDLIARGKYIVEGVAACGDCHTPRDENGESDRTRWLEGAPVFLRPAQAVPGWPVVAPRLAGLPPGTDAEIITLLTTGLWRDGKPLRLPMPRFRMTHRDAESVLAYLKSLNPRGIH
jgi:hypothetical protein